MSEETPKTPQSKVQKLIEDLFPTRIEAPRSLAHPLSVSNIETVEPSAVLARQDLFLEVVAQGWSDAKARKHVHVSQAVLDQWMTDPDFKKKYDDAFGEASGYLEDLAFIRAHESDVVLMRLLEARKPEKYKPKAGGTGGRINVIVAPLFNGEAPSSQPKIIIDQHNEDE